MTNKPPRLSTLFSLHHFLHLLNIRQTLMSEISIVQLGIMTVLTQQPVGLRLPKSLRLRKSFLQAYLSIRQVILQSSNSCKYFLTSSGRFLVLTYSITSILYSSGVPKLSSMNSRLTRVPSRKFIHSR